MIAKYNADKGKMARKINGYDRNRNGTYAVLPPLRNFSRGYDGVSSISPVSLDNLFPNRNGKPNILIYADKDLIVGENSQVYVAFELAQRGFIVGIETKYDADAAERADVVLDYFNSANDGFYDGLRRYDDGTRLMLDSGRQRQVFAGRRTVGDVVDAIIDEIRKIKTETKSAA